MVGLNTTAPIFTSTTQNDFAKKAVAENYMQTYPYAAQDFPTHPDLKAYMLEVDAWMKSVDLRLEAQMELLSTHIHMIPPHTHISARPGDPTSPTPLITLVPVTSPVIKWFPVPYPVYINTSLTIPNYEGNMAVIGTPSQGSAIPDYRRLKPIDITLLPTIAPALQDAMTPSIGSVL